MGTGPRKTSSEHTHITDKVIHAHNFIEYTSIKTQNSPDIDFACIFYRSNIVKLVNMVFEVNKYHSLSNTLTSWVGANTLFLVCIQPSTHSSPNLAARTTPV